MKTYIDVDRQKKVSARTGNSHTYVYIYIYIYRERERERERERGIRGDSSVYTPRQLHYHMYEDKLENGQRKMTKRQIFKVSS